MERDPDRRQGGLDQGLARLVGDSPADAQEEIARQALDAALEAARSRQVYEYGSPRFVRYGVAGLSAIGLAKDRRLLPMALDRVAEVEATRARAGDRGDVLLKSLCVVDAELAVHLHAPDRARVVPRVLARVDSIGDPRLRVKSLAALAPCVDPDLIESWHARLEAVSVSMQGEALVALAARLLDLGGLDRALEIGQSIVARDWRGKALSRLAGHLAGLPETQLAVVWWPAIGDGLLRALARRGRADLLSDVAALGPVIAALGGEEAVSGTFEAIGDVAAWWP